MIPAANSKALDPQVSSLAAARVGDAGLVAAPAAVFRHHRGAGKHEDAAGPAKQKILRQEQLFSFFVKRLIQQLTFLQTDELGTGSAEMLDVIPEQLARGDWDSFGLHLLDISIIAGITLPSAIYLLVFAGCSPDHSTVEDEEIRLRKHHIDLRFKKLGVSGSQIRQSKLKGWEASRLEVNLRMGGILSQSTPAHLAGYPGPHRRLISTATTSASSDKGVLLPNSPQTGYGGGVAMFGIHQGTNVLPQLQQQMVAWRLMNMELQQQMQEAMEKQREGQQQIMSLSQQQGQKKTGE
ncbi:hypothetical protein BDK51DRAFT_28990 [Blyttiomyces helicus]|uniref:Uncharacterized protein n=1 Tax=Blyttiomyces helicus TaxID=388810 RepID=A0A4P9WKJ4_9FUNG|nr:hypothetical protein BDK51DRAFT_28990 [Blyttiomyces helicus]|eukprot:RKO93334.1 hypothetical protein BDK51DRAFT_28990 [Blyttiomyces helicus]